VRVELLPPRIAEKIAVDEATGCWLWTAGKDRDGYARVGWQGRSVSAHRLTYCLLVGEIPTGLEIDHLCRVRHCVQPDHLEPVTHRENTLRGNTIPAAHAARTHCVHGHEFTGANLRISPDGRRECRACGRIKDAGRRSRRRGAA
jgi:hypothetical protein